MKKLNLITLFLAILLSALPLTANTCLDFDGADDYVRIEALGIPSTTDVTIEMWFNWQDTGADNTVDFLISHRVEVLEIHTGGALNNALRFIPRTGVYLDTPANVISKNTWHHLAFAYSSAGAAHCYIDGDEVTLTSNGGSFDYINYIHTDPVLIGARINNDNYFTGMIDDVRMWSTARTQTQIQDNMHVELTGSESGLYKYYKMNEGSGLVTYNSAEAGSGDLINMDENDWVISTAPFLPVVQSLLPTDNSTGVLLDSNLEITFDMNVTAGSGNVIIYKSSDDSIVETISASSCGISGSLVTINPSNHLDLQTDYYILIESDAFHDGSGYYYYGITDKTVWNFKTENYFTDINAGLTNISSGSVTWGDYDNDGDLDILLTGDSSSGKISKIYRNDPGVFTDINAGLEGVYSSSVAWGDYDNDGDLDVLLTGRDGLDNSISKIYRNDSGTFTDINAGLLGVSYSSVAWGDYDNDGDLDILLTGMYEVLFNPFFNSKIYRNDSGVFTDIGAELEDVSYSSVAWGDYDNDGDLDILLTGYYSDGESHYLSKIYRNDSGVFTDINAGLEGVYSSSVAWGDYDNDGDLDILLTGSTYDKSNDISEIYRNDLGVFTNINAGLLGVSYSSVAWGDYDNDGDLDILLTGKNTSRTTKIYNNNSGVFTVIYPGFEYLTHNSVAWADYDNDGDLDLLLTGMHNIFGGSIISKIYRNNSYASNTKPNTPTDLITENNGKYLNLTFDPANDNETPQQGLSYNIDFTIEGVNKTAAMANVATGYRRIVAIGNTSLNNSYDLNIDKIIFPQETTKNISWKVQAIDHSFAGSEFASADTTFVSRDLEIITYDEMGASDLLTWEYASTDLILNYQLQLDEDINFGSPLEEIVPLTKKDAKIIHYSIALNELADFGSLVSNTTYYWRVKPNYESRTGRYNDTLLSFIYDPTYSAPSPIDVTVDGNLVTLSWNTDKEATKGEVYNVYSTDDPYAVFPIGWTLEAIVTNGTQWLTMASELKKFYCVTSASGK